MMTQCSRQLRASVNTVSSFLRLPDPVRTAALRDLEEREKRKEKEHGRE